MRRMICALLCMILLAGTGSGTEPDKYVAITFDDGPSGRFTRRLLDGLAERDVKATFFLCGYRLEDYQSLARRIYDEGHEIGLHGYSHENMGKMSGKELKQEMDKTIALLPEGCRYTFLRPPGGSSSEQLKAVAEEYGVALLNWSVDPRDWANHDAAVVEAAVVEQVQDGDVILLHDMCDCSVDAALSIIDTLQKQGFRFVTVSELAQLRGAEITPGRMYTQFQKG